MDRLVIRTNKEHKGGDDSKHSFKKEVKVDSLAVYWQPQLQSRVTIMRQRIVYVLIIHALASDMFHGTYRLFFIPPFLIYVFFLSILHSLIYSFIIQI